MARRKQYNRYDDEFKATAVALTKILGVLPKDVAEALAIHPVMLYRWCMETRRGEFMTKKKDINIDSKMKAELKRIVYEFDWGDEIYGSPKIHREVKKQGAIVSQKRVARLMWENGLEAKKSKIYRSRPGTQRFFNGISNIIWRWSWICLTGRSLLGRLVKESRPV